MTTLTQVKLIEGTKLVLRIAYQIAKPILILAAFMMAVTFGVLFKVLASTIKGR